MGKKQKIGKQRQDKFYHLAKETGYRSRAAFKLIQLNRKFEFLQRCRVLVDLCAAPGGWLQVAAQNMPVSSLIIGVDLVPIKPLPNVMTLEEDITSDKCKQALKKHLKTWKADVVLNDGAPNVGKNWLHDAFQQAQLTIQALKLATNFLAKGGWFVTKVFRSKDYHALMWVFKQFFKKVYATKPQASRSESAEIFVVCENYLAPDKIDPKLLDVKCVFEEVESEPKAKLNLMFPEKEKRRVEGYPEGATTLHRRVDVSRFVTSSSFVELLNDCNELVFDEEKYEKSKSTTDEIKECCKDIKVLGRKELRLLLTWRKKLHEEFHEVDRVKSDVKAKESSPDEDLRIQHLVEEAQLEELQELKRKKKKVLKERRKLHEKMNLKMILPNDEAVVSEDKSLFYLETIKNKKDLAEVDKGSSKIIEEEEEDVTKMLSKKKTVSYDKEKIVWDDVDSDDDVHDESNDEISINSVDTNSDDDEREESTKIGDDGEKNPLLVDLDDDPHRLQKKKKTKLWFEKDIFSGLEKKSDETYEIDQMTEYFKNKSESRNKSESNPLTVSSHLSVDSNVEKGEEKVEDEKNELHSKSGKKRRQTLDVEGLALGTLMIHSRKKRRDVVDDSWNRYTYADENLPSWFVTDEEKHNKKQLPVSKEMVEEFKQKLKEINARPIKKIAEAKARKKRKMLKKMEKARKKAEAVTDSTDMSEVEKRHRVKAIYKKLMPNKKEEVTYVVAKKGAIGKRARRPAGVKGRFKVVDPRMKKDPSRSQKQEKTRKRK